MAQLSTFEQHVLQSHIQLLNSPGLYKDFTMYNFPHLITESNIGHIIETLSSEDPDQTITVKSAYSNAQKVSSNGLIIKMFKARQPVIDLNNCLYYAYGRNFSQQKLANFSDSEKFCQPSQGHEIGRNIFFNNDHHVQTYLDLFKSGKIEIFIWRICA